MNTQRKNITQPEEWWIAFEKAAEREGLTLSQWIGDRLVKSLPKTAQRKLPPRPAAHRPKAS